jgi:hypothetical protein
MTRDDAEYFENLSKIMKILKMRIIYSLLTQVNKPRYDTRHDNIQQNDTQHTGLILDTLHLCRSAKSLSMTILSAIMQSVVRLNIVVMLNVVMLSVVMLNIVMLSVVMLGVVMLNIVIRSVILLNVIVLYVVILSVLAPNKLIAFKSNLKSLFCNELETIKSLQTIFLLFLLILRRKERL